MWTNPPILQDRAPELLKEVGDNETNEMSYLRQHNLPFQDNPPLVHTPDLSGPAVGGCWSARLTRACPRPTRADREKLWGRETAWATSLASAHSFQVLVVELKPVVTKSTSLHLCLAGDSFTVKLLVAAVECRIGTSERCACQT